MAKIIFQALFTVFLVIFCVVFLYCICLGISTHNGTFACKAFVALIGAGFSCLGYVLTSDQNINK